MQKRRSFHHRNIRKSNITEDIILDAEGISVHSLITLRQVTRDATLTIEPGVKAIFKQGIWLEVWED